MEIELRDTHLNHFNEVKKGQVFEQDNIAFLMTADGAVDLATGDIIQNFDPYERVRIINKCKFVEELE